MSDEGSRAPAYIDFWLPSLALRQSGRGATVQRVPKPRSLYLGLSLSSCGICAEKEPRIVLCSPVLGPPKRCACQRTKFGAWCGGVERV